MPKVEEVLPGHLVLEEVFDGPACHAWLQETGWAHLQGAHQQVDVLGEVILGELAEGRQVKHQPAGKPCEGDRNNEDFGNEAF
jgi:hypothetical protein